MLFRSQFAARVDQVGVDGRFQRTAHEGLGQHLVDFRLGRLQQGMHGQGHGAVAQGRHFEVAQGDAVIARRLAFGERLHSGFFSLPKII